MGRHPDLAPDPRSRGEQAFEVLFFLLFLFVFPMRKSCLARSVLLQGCLQTVSKHLHSAGSKWHAFSTLQSCDKASELYIVPAQLWRFTILWESVSVWQSSYTTYTKSYSVFTMFIKCLTKFSRYRSLLFRSKCRQGFVLFAAILTKLCKKTSVSLSLFSLQRFYNVL